MATSHTSEAFTRKRAFARKLTAASFATALATTLTLSLSGGFSPAYATTAPEAPASESAAAESAAPETGAAEAAELAVVVNEVESNGDDTDWVEFGNPSGQAVDLTGYIFTDNEPTKAGHTYVLPEGSVVPSNGFFVLDQAQGSTPGFDFGLGKDDSVNLYAPPAEGESVEDAIAKNPVLTYSWTSHAAITYGRCPDFTGEMIDTFASTKGAANQCEEPPAEPSESADPSDPSTPAPLSPSAWPGGQTVKPLHDADEARGDWSGLFWEAAGAFGSDKPYLWVAENGNGTLLRLDGTEANRGAELQTFTLKYADGTGTPDAEAVTRAAGAPNSIFVGTERDNSNKGTSRPSVLAFTTPSIDDADGELKAAKEWNLAPDFPGLGANSGIEGLTWIPDSWLVENKIHDESTGKPYDPSAYPAHHGGVFAVGIEGTGHVYLYVLNEDGSFQRIADIETGLDVVAEVLFDAHRSQLGAICDDACEGRIAVLTPAAGADTASETDAATDTDADKKVSARSATTQSADDAAVKLAVSQVLNRPSETQNYANEGFAIADMSQCKDGALPVFYADDNNTDDVSLREGTLTTKCPTEQPPVEEAPSEDAPSEQPSEDAPSDEPSEQPSEEAPSSPAPSSPAPSTPVPDNAAVTTPGSGSTDAGANTGGGDLARTGADVNSWMMFAAAAMLVGGALTLTLRRKHSGATR